MQLFFIFILLLLLVGIACALFYMRRSRKEWELELLYLTRHQKKDGHSINNKDEDKKNYRIDIKPIKKNMREVYNKILKQQPLHEKAEHILQEEKHQQVQKFIKKNKQNQKQLEDLFDLPIFAEPVSKKENTKVLPTDSETEYGLVQDMMNESEYSHHQTVKQVINIESIKPTVKTEQIKTIVKTQETQNQDDKVWDRKHPISAIEDTALLTNPHPNLQVITLEETQRVQQQNILFQEEKPIVSQDIETISPEDLNLPSYIIDQISKKTKKNALPSVNEQNKTERVIDNTSLNTISGDEIRVNLLKQRLARRQDDLQQKKEQLELNTIQEAEVLTNLAKTDSPINRLRHKVKRQVIKESIIPASAKINDEHTFAHNIHPEPQEIAPISTRFTPFNSSKMGNNHEVNLSVSQAPWGIDDKLLKEVPVEVHIDVSGEELLEREQQDSDWTDINTNKSAKEINIEFQELDSIDTYSKKTATSIDQPNVNINSFDAEQSFDDALDISFDLNETTQNHPEIYIHETQSLVNYPHETVSSHSYQLPDLSLLEVPKSQLDIQQTEENLLENSIKIEDKLNEFKVKVKVVDAYAGPVITRYEIEPDTGVRGNQVLNLEKDLARALGSPSIRIVETIPGKTSMGLELPNPKRKMIRLSEVLASPVFIESKSQLTLVLGEDITGEPVVTDLAKAPHLLVAGTTGSGKSVGVNAMILSMLYKATPEDVRLIMIDPKMLELSIYEGIPHLLAPVVTDMRLAANALLWCVNEMEKRYRLMSHIGVRNLAGYNTRIQDALNQGKKIANPFSLTPDDPESLEKLPFIVVVVDEFADLMMTAGKKIEELIARLAQKARAAGIHLILATQRPSVDVITGLIKANIPTRIAFQVSSKVDSRTIIDQMGAENLLGQGDMLFLPPGTGYPQRIHGAFVADSEVHRIVEYLKQFGEPNYIDDILTAGTSSDDLFSNANNQRNNDVEDDPLYDEAVAIVIKTRKASISFVQRNLRIGYNRAARLIEQMEMNGIVSAPENNGNRTVLVASNEIAE